MLQIVAKIFCCAFTQIAKIYSFDLHKQAVPSDVNAQQIDMIMINPKKLSKVELCACMKGKAEQVWGRCCDNSYDQKGNN